MSKQVILTGLRANNDLHIGNYFGALLPLIDMAKKRAGQYQVNLFVPDLHSFTTPIDHSQLHEQIMHNLRLFVAAGLPLDNPNVYIYRQSYIPAHSELTVILNCFTGFGEMSRMTQFKDKAKISEANLPKEKVRIIIERTYKELDKTFARYKSLYTATELSKSEFQNLLKPLVHDAALYRTFGAAQHGIASSVGLFDYPVLMAADILLYGAQYVPVGDDQTQHLEFTRDIAERLNKRFGDLFTVPAPVKKQHEFFGKEQGLRIKDLADPTKKMSKSDDSGKGIIFLGDDPKAAANKIMGATTDSVGSINLDFDNQPGVSNLLQILALLYNRPLTEVAAQYQGQTQYGPLKQAVAEAVGQFLTDFQQRLAHVDEVALQRKLEASEAAMNTVANKTLLSVQTAIGLRA